MIHTVQLTVDDECTSAKHVRGAEAKPCSQTPAAQKDLSQLREKALQAFRDQEQGSNTKS